MLQVFDDGAFDENETFLVSCFTSTLWICAVGDSDVPS